MPIDITDQDRRAQYVINGLGPYDFDFEVLATTDVAVYRDAALLTMTADYTVNVNDDGTGAITLILATGTTLTILGARPYARLTDFATGGDFRADTVNDELDSIQIQILQIDERVDRSIKVAAHDTSGVSIDIPTARANKFLAFDANGFPIASSGTGVDLGLREDLATPGGSTLVAYVSPGIGAVPTTAAQIFDERISVKRFGASAAASGAENNVAFQACINYCQDNLKTMFIPTQGPSLVYTIDGTLEITKPLTMLGEGSRNVILQFTGLGVGQFGLDIDGTVFGTYEQGNIGGFTVMTDDSVGDLIRIKNVSNSKFVDIGLRDARRGITYTGTRCFSNVFEKIIHITGIAGAGSASFVMITHTGGGHHTFVSCSLGGGTAFSLSFDTITDNVVFVDTNFEQCSVNSVFVGGTCDGLGFLGCRTEGCDGQDFQLNPDVGARITGLLIKGCTFSASDAGGSARIALGGTGGIVRGFDISGNTVTHGAHNFSANFVTLNGEGESGTVANNFLDGLITLCSPCSAPRAGVSVYNNEGNNGKFVDEQIGAPLAGGNFTRDIATASGTQAVTGVGFKPRAVLFFSNVNGSAKTSWGFTLASAQGVIFDNSGSSADTQGMSTSNLIYLVGTGSDTAVAALASLDADGFTVSWVKVGSPTGTATIFYVAWS